MPACTCTYRTLPAALPRAAPPAGNYPREHPYTHSLPHVPGYYHPEGWSSNSILENQGNNSTASGLVIPYDSPFICANLLRTLPSVSSVLRPPRTAVRVPPYEGSGGLGGKKERKPPVCSHYLEPKCHMRTCNTFAPLSYIKYYTSTTPTLEARDVIILNLSLAVASTVF